MSISISGNGSFTGATADYSFDQSVGIAGTLTYEDVTSVDSVGIITARSGIKVGPTSGIGITLNANGSATFAGGKFNLYVNGSFEQDGGASFGNNVTIKDGATTKITIANDGTATFAGGVTQGAETTWGTGNQNDDSKYYMYAGSDGSSYAEILIQNASTSTRNPFSIYKGKATDSNNQVVVFETDGKATFASWVTGNIGFIAGANPGTAQAGAKMTVDGTFTASNNSSTLPVYQAFDVGGNSDPTFKVMADGSATFDGDVKIGTTGSFTPSTPAITLSASNGGILTEGYVEVRSPNDNNNAFQVFNPDGSRPVEIRNNGSAAFTGNITANAKKLGTGAAGTGKVVGYQQGTWTPVYAESGNTNNEATNYASRTAYWWRIGDVVTVTATLNMASSTGISPNNALILKDFPYVCQNVNAYYGSSSSVHANGWTDNTVVYVNIIVPPNTTKADLYYTTSAQAGNYNGVDYSKIGTGSLIFNLSYLTDDATWTPVNGATVAS